DRLIGVTVDRLGRARREERRDARAEELGADYEHDEDQRDEDEQHDEDPPQRADRDDDGVLQRGLTLDDSRSNDDADRSRLLVLGDPDDSGGTCATRGGRSAVDRRASRAAAAVLIARGAGTLGG